MPWPAQLIGLDPTGLGRLAQMGLAEISLKRGFGSSSAQ